MSPVRKFERPTLRLVPPPAGGIGNGGPAEPPLHSHRLLGRVLRIDLRGAPRSALLAASAILRAGADGEARHVSSRSSATTGTWSIGYPLRCFCVWPTRRQRLETFSESQRTSPPAGIFGSLEAEARFSIVRGRAYDSDRFSRRGTAIALPGSFCKQPQVSILRCVVRARAGLVSCSWPPSGFRVPTRRSWSSSTWYPVNPFPRNRDSPCSGYYSPLAR